MYANFISTKDAGPKAIYLYLYIIIFVFCYKCKCTLRKEVEIWMSKPEK